MERICPKCGGIVSGDSKFCPNCGTEVPGAVNLTKSVPDAVATPDSAPTPVNPTYTGSGDPGYSQPVYPQQFSSEYTEEMTLGQWVGTILLTSCLGIISLILLFVWGFGSTPQPKKNYCRAMLIVQAIMLGICLVIMIGACACGGIALSQMGNSVNWYNY